MQGWGKHDSGQATSGFEPLNKAFAELSLTTWVRRLGGRNSIKMPQFYQTKKSKKAKSVLPNLQDENIFASGRLL